MPELLEVANLRRVFPARGAVPEIVAVSDVSFSVSSGESLAIVGESGSGKSTIARMLVGLDHQTSGHIRVNGTPRSSGRPRARERRRRAREIQIVFQDPYSSLDPKKSVGWTISDALRVGGYAARDRQARVMRLLDDVGLRSHHVTALPRSLSGGQRQRVAIARSLATEPQMLVLDEAVSALDVSTQAQILNLLADVRERTGVAYLFITHDLAVVNQISERCLVMRAGRVMEQGATSDVLHAPASDYTRALRDAVPRAGWRPVRTGRPRGERVGEPG